MEAERLRILLSDVGCKGNADERVVLMGRDGVGVEVYAYSESQPHGYVRVSSVGPWV